jgi:hypothetical protein
MVGGGRAEGNADTIAKAGALFVAVNLCKFGIRKRRSMGDDKRRLFIL